MYVNCQILSQYLPSTTPDTAPVAAVSAGSVSYDVEACTPLQVVSWAAIFCFLCLVFSTTTTAAVILKVLCHVELQADQVTFLLYLGTGFKISDILYVKSKGWGISQVRKYKLRTLINQKKERSFKHSSYGSLALQLKSTWHSCS